MPVKEKISTSMSIPRTRPVLKYVKEAQEKPNFGPLVEEALQNLKVTRISPLV